MESMHGGHARVANSKKKKNECLFSCQFTHRDEQQAFAEAMEELMPPEGGATGQNQLIYRSGDVTDASDENSDSALNVTLQPGNS